MSRRVKCAVLGIPAGLYHFAILRKHSPERLITQFQTLNRFIYCYLHQLCVIQNVISS
jgi:hypothetical protein